MLTDQEMHDRMVRGWRAGRPFTDCGNGSLPENTARIRAWLPDLCQRHGIRVLNDAGAGDLAWMQGLQWDVDYRPFDLIPRRPEVQRADVTAEALPPADAILCRMVLNHLDDERVVMALHAFKRSAPLLIATQFNGEDLPKRSPQFTRLDLRRWLGEPLETCRDGNEEWCRLALWKI
jgi:hypothetical protein